MTQPVPVLLLTGPVGAGKSTVAGEAARLLRDAHISHALVDLAHVADCFPVPPDDPWNERLTQRNLACLWANFQAAGAERLILCRVLEARSLLRHVTASVPGAAITVVRLRVRRDVLEERIRVREAGRDPAWYLGAAAYLAETLEQAGVEDFVVENEGRPAVEAAREALLLARWLGSTTGAGDPV
ncbi:MAG: hypothetical protein JOZ89_11500 [Gammaproteobacteria bacterium]|nr:hypothetical protein [Gammaproteobacteria bacterium]